MRTPCLPMVVPLFATRDIRNYGPYAHVCDDPTVVGSYCNVKYTIVAVTKLTRKKRRNEGESIAAQTPFCSSQCDVVTEAIRIDIEQNTTKNSTSVDPSAVFTV